MVVNKDSSGRIIWIFWVGDFGVNVFIFGGFEMECFRCVIVKDWRGYCSFL